MVICGSPANVGLYSRISRDDNNGGTESMSIANQRQILSDYAEQRGWNIVECYVDDGWSGTNFDRPDFQRMLKDIERGRINCVITKDLSRLGRNYSMTGYYIDEYFPVRMVRYIAINDNVDTMGNENDFAAFHNVIKNTCCLRRFSPTPPNTQQTANKSLPPAACSCPCLYP